MELVTILLFIKKFLTISSPIIFGVGVILLIAPATYRRLEEVLAEEVGGLKKQVIPFLERVIGNFQNWLLIKTNAVAIFLIFISIIFFIISKKI